MDKNTITGLILMGVVLFAFSWLNKPSVEQAAEYQRAQDSIAKVEMLQQAKIQQETIVRDTVGKADELLSDTARHTMLVNKYGVFANAVQGEEEFLKLENKVLDLTFSTKGGRLFEARLKDYHTYDSLPLILFKGAENNYGFTLITANQRIINTADLYFEPVKSTNPNQVVLRLNAGEGSYMDFIYTVQPDNYMIKFDVKQKGMQNVLAVNSNTMNLFWEQTLRRQEKGRKFEEQYSNLFYKFAADNVEYLSSSKDEKKSIPNRLKWIGYKNQFFSTVMISDKNFNNAVLDSKIDNNENYLKKFRSETDVEYNSADANPMGFSMYLGPNSYPLLKKYDKGKDTDRLELAKLVPLGASVFRWVNEYAVIPLFTFFGGFVSNYGIIILLLTIVIKMVLYPLTYKSYMSSAKMRVLRPEIEAINEKLPGKDKAMERQRATMDLYSKVGINPMSGCLPMLLQMPILFAMFQFFPSSIELRQESFLWAKDLSTYDSIYSWDAYIPLITPYFGNHISLFCLLMTITNLVYTKLNMDAQGTQTQMPGMKFMMYAMPLMFLVFFNNYASGLSYYYFVSTLITIIQTYSFRFIVNEEKLLAQLKANAKKPKKKSGFMARLEEAQRQQQDAMKKKQKGKK